MCDRHSADAVVSKKSKEAPAQGELLAALVENLPTMVAYWDADQRCRFANPGYQRWFGVSADEIIGKHASELIGPAYATNLPYIEAALRGTPQELERTTPDPGGGAPRHSVVTYVPDIIDGVVRGLFVHLIDVSARKRAEVALRDSEERFRLTLDETPIGMALVAPDGRFTRVNRALCELLGYSPAELTGLTFNAITHPDDLDVGLAALGQLVTGEIDRYQFGKRYRRKDGTYVDVMISGSALRDSNGVPIHFISQVQDVTEQKRAEAEQRLLAAVGPIFAASLDFEDTLSRIAELVVHEKLADLCMVEILETADEPRAVKAAGRDPEQLACFERNARKAIDRSRPHVLRPVFEHKQSLIISRVSQQELEASTQSEAHLEAIRVARIESLIGVPLVVQDRVIGAIALISSGSGKIYSPADVRLAEALAQCAALSIENARLYRAARRATKARDDLLGVVVHDLRNPLNTMLLHAALLHEGSVPGQRERSVHAIERSANRMQRLIQDLLDVSRIEAGELPMETARLVAKQVLTEAVEAQRALAAAASLDLRLVAPDETLEIWADRDRLYQIFENLIGNAIKFTDAGGTITVAAIAQANDVLFFVSDTGHGIAAADLPHVFDRFWQADQLARRKGAGLGLPIVKGLVEAHGGRIWLDSTPNRGTTFYFTLPLAPASARDVEESAPDRARPMRVI